MNEIYLSFDYYETQFETGIDEVYLSGGSSLIFGLKDFLAENLGEKIYMLNPFLNFEIDEQISNKINQLGSKLAVSAGLALED